MELRLKFYQLKQYVQKKWFNIALIVLAAMLVLKKDLSINFNIKAPLEKERSGIPGVVSPKNSSKNKKSKTKVTEKLGTSIVTNKNQGSMPDPFSLFTPASIPENPDPPAKSEDHEISKVSPDQVKTFVSRFGDVAKNEMKKFRIPASIILAQSLLSSHAGLSKVAKTTNNYFALPCSSGWEGPTAGVNETCFRKYETAWFSFRDHTNFITTGSFRHLTNLDPKDYKRWANGLELAGYTKSSGYAELLINTIEEFGLNRFDN